MEVQISKEDLATLITTAELSLSKLEDEDKAEVLRIIRELQAQSK